MSVGLKVHYKPSCGPSENGMVKSWYSHGAWVVYKCDGQWHRFKDFTGCSTSYSDLGFGWVVDQSN